MSRRIEVELTSERDDGTWTWRAAGARQPKGVVDSGLLYAGAKVGDVVRAEADFDIEGITIIAVQPPRHARQEGDRLEIIGPPREFKPVIANVSPAAARGEDRRPRDRSSRDRDGERPRRPGGPSGPGGDRRPRPDRGPRPEGAGRPSRPERPRRERPPAPEPKPKPKRLRPSRTHRDAAVASLPPEQQPVAEQVLRGGVPAVRAALEEQNAGLRAEGRPEINPDNVVALAEELHVKLRVAEWLDRADAALADVDEINLRDLRSVVVSADDVAREESTREIATRLREALEVRVEKAQSEWLADITGSLDDGRVVRALRLSARPPEPGFKFPPELHARLAEAASTAMAPDIVSDRWATVLDAVAYSPVRRDVTPAGVPENRGDDLVAMARKHVGRVPAIAPLFGLEPPPPPAGRKPRRPARPARTAPPHVGNPPRPPGAPPPPPPGFRAARPPGAAADATVDAGSPVTTGAPEVSSPATTPDAPPDAVGTPDPGAPTTTPPEPAPAAQDEAAGVAQTEPDSAPAAAVEPEAAPPAEVEAAPPVEAEPAAAAEPEAEPAAAAQPDVEPAAAAEPEADPAAAAEAQVDPAPVAEVEGVMVPPAPTEGPVDATDAVDVNGSAEPAVPEPLAAAVPTEVAAAPEAAVEEHRPEPGPASAEGPSSRSEPATDVPADDDPGVAPPPTDDEPASPPTG